MSAPRTFELGQRVQITGTVEKVRSYDPHQTTYREAGLPSTSAMYIAGRSPSGYDDWRTRITTHDTGFIVGTRTIADYDVRLGSYDEPTEAVQRPGSQRTVVLVAWRLRRKPVMVYPHQIVEATP